MRTREQKYPSYEAEIEAIEKGGITDELLNRIIQKHSKNAERSRELIERYECLADGVPIFDRKPRFGEGDEVINHKINNDFFSEIVDFKTGYFAGNPIAYSYSDTQEALEDTGDAGDSTAEMDEAREEASKMITDFVTRSNMFDIDMETTKFASICGYSGRLFYHDTDGNERVMVVPPDECIILSKTRDITHPTYGVRYYTVKDINDAETVKAEFYDSVNIYYAEGSKNDLNIMPERTAPNLFDCCPLQGIPNNREMMGDAEKVLALIDAYDRALSDANNELSAFANAYMIFKNLYMEEDEKRKSQISGSIEFHSNGQNDSDVYFLTKDINDAFIEHHLDRLEDNIRHFSSTPNLSDESFGTASGVALKHKMMGLESKCGMFEAKHISAGRYMFELLAKSWEKKQVKIDPLLVVMEYKRNFPLDLLTEAQAAQALIAAGVPEVVAWGLAISGIDDPDYVKQVKEQEKDGIPSLTEDDDDDDTKEDAANADAD